MRFLTAPLHRRLEEIERKYLQTARQTIVVKTDERLYRELAGNEHWALDVEVVDNRHIGHWRVSTVPGDIGRRPHYPFPVLYFYFINEEPKPEPDSTSDT